MTKNHPGLLLRSLRLARNWSMRRLQEESEIDASQISRIENGIFIPKYGTIARFAVAFAKNTPPGEPERSVDEYLGMLAEGWFPLGTRPSEEDLRETHRILEASPDAALLMRVFPQLDPALQKLVVEKALSFLEAQNIRQ